MACQPEEQSITAALTKTSMNICEPAGFDTLLLFEAT